MESNIKIMINSKKAANIIGGSISMAAGLIASIGINELYKLIDKTGVSKGRRYLMDCGIRGITIAAITPHINAGVKQLMAAYSDEGKLISIGTEPKAEEPKKEDHGGPEDMNVDPILMEQKNRIIEMLHNLVTAHGDIQWKLDSMYEDPVTGGEYTISSISTAVAEDWKEFLSEVNDYNNKLHKALGNNYAFPTLKNHLKNAAGEFALQINKNTGDTKE